MKRWLHANNTIPIFRERVDLIVVLAFAVFVAAIRLPYLGYLSFWWDEAAQVLSAEGILRYGLPILPSGLFYGHGPLCSYSIASSFVVFGKSEFSARIISLIFSSLTLPVVYLLGKDLGDKRAGVIATVIVAFSPWAVAWARQARMYAQFQFFFLLTLYIFYKNYFIKDNPRHPLRNFVLFIVSFTGALSSHESTLTLIPSLFAYLLITRRVKKIRFRYFVFAAFVLVLTVIFFWVFSLAPLGLGIPEFTFRPSWLRANLLWSYEPFHTRYPVLSLFVVMGASVLLMKKDKRLLYLYINFLVPLHLVPIIIGGLSHEVYDRYLFFLLPLFALASSFSLLQHTNVISGVVAKEIGKIKTYLNVKKLEKIVPWIIITIVVFPVISNLYVRVFVPDSHISLTEAFSYYQPEHRSPWIDIDIEYGGVRGACKFIKQHYQDEDAIISSSMHIQNEDAIVINNKHLPVYYYLEETVSKENLFHLILKVERVRDVYLRCTIIKSLDGLEDVLYHHTHVWIIIDERLIELYVSHEVIDFISENTKLVYENKEEHVNVYVWPKV